MIPTTFPDFLEAQRHDEAYYTPDRWWYINRVATVSQVLFSQDRVLELGPYHLPVFKGYGVSLMDLQNHRGNTKERFTTHDANVYPWPYDREFDTFIALQVLEHLEDKASAFTEAFKVARNVVVSVPYMWRKSGLPGHDGLTRETVVAWAGRYPNYSEVWGTRLFCYFSGVPVPL